MSVFKYNSIDELKELILSNIKNDDFIKNVSSIHPLDLYKVFETLDENQKQELINVIPNEILADIISYFDDEEAAELLSLLPVEKSSKILNNMDSDDAVDIINEIDDNSEIVNNLDEDVKELIEYNENQAGSIMNNNYISISSDMDVKDAMKTMIRCAGESEIIDPLFVLDNEKLIGIVSLKDLIIARSPMQIKDLMDTNITSCNVDDHLDDVNNLVNNYDIYALPVLDGDKMVGVITIDDAFESIIEGMKKDYKQMMAINTVEKDDNIFKIFLKRLPWLLMLLVLSILITNVTKIFEEAINQVLVLAFFQTMLLDMAGNIGTQSLAVTIQKMSSGEFENKKHEVKHIFNEFRINLINSFILSILAFGICFLFLLFRYPNQDSKLMISVVISLSLLLTLLISSIISTILPLILKKFKVDPAVASGPFISTLNDIISILIYFGIAILLLGLEI